MILPTKHIAQERALLTVGAKILGCLDQATTVSSLWDQVSRESPSKYTTAILRYEYFVLALDLLFLLGAVQLVNGVISRTKV